MSGHGALQSHFGFLGGSDDGPQMFHCSGVGQEARESCRPKLGKLGSALDTLCPR